MAGRGALVLQQLVRSSGLPAWACRPPVGVRGAATSVSTGTARATSGTGHNTTSTGPTAPATELSKLWPAGMRSADITVPLSAAAQAEMRSVLKPLAAQLPASDLDSAPLTPSLLPETAACLRELESAYLVRGPGMVLLPKVDGLDSIHEMRLAAYAVTCALGEAQEQNAQGQRTILVFDRDANRRMKDGQRYHQSSDGGSLHTDNVNVPETWEHMVLTCLQPAHIGGESIFVSVSRIHEFMACEAPDALETLEGDFLWEYRGFHDGFYRAPILFRNRYGEPSLRYLRDYMESAHERLGQPLSAAQRWALDVLDSVANMSRFQVRCDMAPGEMALVNDMHVFHGRTGFIDRQPATADYDFANPVNRLMQRTWLRTHTAEFQGMNNSPFEVMAP